MDSQAKSIRIERAVKNDVPRIAALFTECFRESVIHHCGKLPRPLAMQDVFTLVYEAEPEAALVAKTALGEIIGYCFAPVKLSALWQRCIFTGTLFVWAWRWLTGQYGFGFYPVKIIAINKLLFLRSSLKPSKAANARILSIAVTKTWRGRGVAAALLAEAIDYFAAQGAKRVRLEVRPDNAPAVTVYEKYGFVLDGKTRDSQGEWLIMFKEMEQKHV